MRSVSNRLKIAPKSMSGSITIQSASKVTGLEKLAMC